MQIGSLFAGIGGFDLAASWLGWTTAWYSEVDPYACAVMHKHFPSVPNLGDIRLIDGKTTPKVDVLCGGFPCQGVSLVGKGAGLRDPRSGLWDHYRRLIEAITPSWVVIENVSALRGRGLDQVLGQLATLGYDAEWHCIPATAVGAPHRRDRIWIVAYPDGEYRRKQQREFGCVQARARSEFDWSSQGCCISNSDSSLANSAGEPQSEPRHQAQTVGGQRDTRMVACGSGTGFNCVESDTTVANCKCERLEGFAGHGQNRCRRTKPDGSVGSSCVCSRANTTQAGILESYFCRMVDGLSTRLDGCGPWLDGEWPDVPRVAPSQKYRVERLTCLGNAIVPQIAYLIFSAIAQAS